MPFAFEDKKRFSDNVKEFLRALDGKDAAMGKILRENLDKLAAIVKDGDRDLHARAQFNESVCEALDQLLDDDANDGSD